MNALSAHRPEAQRLAEIRASLANIAPGDFRLAHDGERFFAESIGEMGEVVRMLTFDAAATDAERDFIVGAPDTVRFLMHLVERAIEAFAGMRRVQGEREAQGRREERGEPQASDPKNFAAECAMKCQEPAFRVFLEEKHGLERPLTDERVNQKVRSILGVQSRKELNNDGQAAERWKALRGDFETWRRGNR